MSILNYKGQKMNSKVNTIKASGSKLIFTVDL